MEQTKLTIRLPRDLLDGAKRYAYEQGTTLTRLVAAYLGRLETRDEGLAAAPTVERLTGILPPDASPDDYYRYLEEKHGSSS